MMRGQEVLWEILVPCAWNSGRPIHTRHHKMWDERVRKITKGLTIFSVGKGQWITPEGVEFLERVIPVRIMCTVDEIRQIANITIAHYEQEAVFFYVVSEIVGTQHATDKQRANFTGAHKNETFV